MRKVIILQARLASSRFPNKVLAELNGRPMIAHIIDRLRASAEATEVCAAIPAESSEDQLAQVLADMGVTICRGHPTDVLGRYVQAAYQTNAQVIVRATADNPLVDPKNIDAQLAAISAEGVDYVITEGMPVGVTAETLTLKTLEKLDYLARSNNHREHVTLYLRENPGPFAIQTLQAEGLMRRPSLSLTVDTRADFDVVQQVYSRLQAGSQIVDMAEVIKLYDEEPKLYQAGGLVGSLSA